MKVNWLIEDFNNDAEPLINEVKNQGLNHEVIKYVPFESGSYNHFKNEDCVVFHGSLNLMRQLQRQKSWIPGGWCNFKNFECTTYYSYFGKYLLNSDYIILPLSEFERRKDDIYGDNDSSILFIRPNSGAKSFTGQTIRFSDFDHDMEWIREFSTPESLVIVSPALSQPIDVEYRFFACNGEILTGSIYKQKGELYSKRFDNQDHPVYKIALAVAKEKWQPDPIYCIDVAEVAVSCTKSIYGIIEINSFSCSGIYDCDPKPLVKVATELASKEWENINRS